LKLNKILDPRELLDVSQVSIELAKELIRYSRYSIEYYFSNQESPPEPKELIERFPIVKKRSAVFITLEKLSGSRRELRGCIGFVIPYMPLWRAVSESAISSAFKDPRFSPLERSEMNDIVIELSILSLSHRLTDPLREVLIGRDGLYVVRGLYSGVLLPQVPIDYCWDNETFLAETCMKAGLEPDCWLDDKTEVYAIPGRIFSEIEPNGEIIERDLLHEYREKCGYSLER
jgi:uncharacterized protein (TIGR00296 family)